MRKANCLLLGSLLALSAAERAEGTESDELAEAMQKIEALAAENERLRNELASMRDAPGTQKTDTTVDAKSGPAAEAESHGAASQESFTPQSWMTVEYQFDTRGFNTINFTGATTLPHGFSIWGFIDIEANKSNEDQRFDSNTFFYEIDLKYNLTKQFGLIGEINDAPGINDALGRAGVFYKPDIDYLKENNAWVYIKAFPVETDGEGAQFSMAWNKKLDSFLDGRFSVGGFIDFNFDSGANQDDINIVSDTQFRYALTPRLNLLAELRINEFLAADKEIGVGLGLQYRF